MEEQGRELVTPQIEKRLHRRAKLVTHVQCDTLGRNDLLVTRDVSTGGMFVSTNTPLPIESLVGLSFNLGMGKPVISCKGKVVFSKQGMGMGIEFVGLSDESRQSLEKFVDETI